MLERGFEWLCTELHGRQICSTCYSEQLTKPIMATHGNLEAFLTTVQEMGKRARHASNTHLIQLKKNPKKPHTYQSDASCIK